MMNLRLLRPAWVAMTICALLLTPAAEAARKSKKAKSEKEGTLPQDKIMKVVEQNKAGIKQCYEMAKLRKPDIEGSITVRWKVFPEGNVESCEVVESSLDDKETAGCITGEIKNWTFPKPKGGVVTVTFPFNFKNTDKGKPKEEPKPAEGAESQPQSQPDVGDLFGVGDEQQGDEQKAAPVKKSKKKKKKAKREE
ncbi:MAG: AgmX/PglI C-terminal domain-containing protein [Deltaproteobacteria bacterium]|nr:AgmX/PglI C-terminal domain-containing protein [Deltaproteobacteria bacterium]